MSDLVNRLCGIANEERHNQHVNGISFVCDQAADRIAALEAENNELQAWVDGYREHGTRVLNANKEEIDTLESREPLCRCADDDGQRECEWAKIDGMRRFKTKCGTISHTAYITPFCYNCGGKVRLREKDDGS